ncbi:uncharacterized protein LOC144003798 isoform X2 [Festucalex cinctus]
MATSWLAAKWRPARSKHTTFILQMFVIVLWLLQVFYHQRNRNGVKGRHWACASLRIFIFGEAVMDQMHEGLYQHHHNKRTWTKMMCILDDESDVPKSQCSQTKVWMRC